MKQTVIKARITLTEPMLGSLPGNKALMEEYIASKAETVEKVDEEVANVEEQLEKGTTVFPRDENGKPFMWDYQFKGFLKAAIGTATEMGDIKGLSKWTFKRHVNQLVFVDPRRMPLLSKPEGATEPVAPEITMFERTIRVVTMQGERVALVRSERIEAGAWFETAITLLSGSGKGSVLEPEHIVEALNYGKFCGLLQWRSASFGRFTWEQLA